MRYQTSIRYQMSFLSTPQQHNWYSQLWYEKISSEAASESENCATQEGEKIVVQMFVIASKYLLFLLFRF